MEDESIPTTSKSEVEGLIRQLHENKLDPAAKDKIERLLRTVLSLVLLLEKRNTSITKLKKLIFGKKSEHDRDSKSRHQIKILVVKQVRQKIQGQEKRLCIRSVKRR